MEYKNITVDGKEYAYRFFANKYCITLHVLAEPEHEDLRKSPLWKIPVPDKFHDRVPEYIRESGLTKYSKGSK